MKPSVRRETLYSSSRSPTSSPEPSLQRLFLNRVQLKFKEEHHSESSNVALEPHENRVEPKPAEVDFRLFAAPTKANHSSVSKIRVRSPSPANQPCSMVNVRPRSYYFAEETSPNILRRYQSTALSGEEVIARSRQGWPGCSLPWRVMRISVKHDQKTSNLTLADDSYRNRTKSRKGKKARIAARKKIVMERERAILEQTSAKDKDLLGRMKKAKRNREKKLKKRERDKLKKATVGPALGSAAAEFATTPDGA